MGKFAFFKKKKKKRAQAAFQLPTTLFIATASFQTSCCSSSPRIQSLNYHVNVETK